jgi:hypothetical protein
MTRMDQTEMDSNSVRLTGKELDFCNAWVPSGLDESENFNT